MLLKDCRWMKSQGISAENAISITRETPRTECFELSLSFCRQNTYAADTLNA